MEVESTEASLVGPLPDPAEPARNGDFRDLRSFVNDVPNMDTFYCSEISILKDGWAGAFRNISVVLKRRHTRAMEDCDVPNSQELSISFQIAKSSEFLEVVRMLAACPTWTHGQFVFCNESDFVPVLDGLMLTVFSLICASRSLSSLDISFDGFSHWHLPVLLSRNLSVENLFLTSGFFDSSQPQHEESIAEYLLGNSVLKSCTLALPCCEFKKLLKPFLTGVLNEANVELKELVLRMIRSESWDCGDAIATVVRYNTTLVKLELQLQKQRLTKDHCQVIARSLGFNRTLKEFGFPCSVSDMKRLVSVFIPDQSGSQANTSLCTLKLFTAEDYPEVQFMNELARMLKCNTTLKHVIVSEQWGESRKSWWQSTTPRFRELKTQGKLNLMVRNELSQNTSLQSLVVGNWTLLRVGIQWETSYNGPCLLSKRPSAEYVVKVEMPRGRP